jgi:hypothetical protein
LPTRASSFASRDQRRIEGLDGWFDGCPFFLAALTLGHAGLETSLVLVGARIADILVAVAFGKEDAKADTARDIGIRRVEAAGAGNGGSEIDNVPKWRLGALRIGGRRLHDAEQAEIFIDQRLVVGIEIGRRDCELVWFADFRRQRIGEILVGADQRIACEIKRLAGQVR